MVEPGEAVEADAEIPEVVVAAVHLDLADPVVGVVAVDPVVEADPGVLAGPGPAGPAGPVVAADLVGQVGLVDPVQGAVARLVVDVWLAWKLGRLH